MLHAERRGELGTFEPFARVEHQHRAIALVQPVGRGPHQRGGIGGRQRIRRFVVEDEDIGFEIDGSNAATLLQTAEAHVTGNREQPCAQTFEITQLTDPLRGEYEGVVGRVGGLVAIA